ncbi:FxLYD domain-containing protein [Schinkia azotoformans]|uniref:FxLYD domain-containing protein n=1 Tax=Schinkia azotoformans TaxID=1454 RepID=UPI002DBD499B|nr:FxLYD domain-containing protein [Schinkia azotoformans]MEC1714701.1 FxLYD domain-containing protein [Schinkia azotoformans]MEC1757543.1 FxLYD domain-containing protein [Schinkia azotoformans]
MKEIILLICLSIIIVGCSSKNSADTNMNTSDQEDNNLSDEIKAKQLADQALEAMNNKEYIRSKELFEESQKYSNDLFLDDFLSDVENGIRQMNNAKEYSPNIEIHNVEINKYDSNGNIFIKGTIKNNGDKTITYGLVKIYYLDQSGNKIGEELATIGAAAGDSQIKPNYIGEFIFNVPDGIKANWSEQYELKVHLLEFDDN